MLKEERNEAELLIALALKEDEADNDTTSQYALKDKPNHRSTLELIAKQHMVVAGLPLVPLVFPPPYQCTLHEKDGALVDNNAILATIHGATQTLLARERTCLNLLQILSGIATLTHAYSQKLRNYPARLLDTRKTIPGMRHLSKYATGLGGADNHRLSLLDTLFIKDNHIAAYGDRLTTLVHAITTRTPHKLLSTLIVECDSLEKVQEALALDVPYILLDNMSIADIRQAVLINKRARIEVSGGITLETIEEVAACGVDFISVGALTLSAPAMDISARLIHV